MFFFVLGLPGRFADWCDATAVLLMHRALGPAALLRADTLEEFGRAALTGGARQAIVASRQPGGRLRAAIARPDGRCVIALDEPGPALADLVLHDGVEFAAAVQAIAGSCAALAGHAAMPGALLLRRERDWAPATGAAIASHLQLAVYPEEIVELGLAAPTPPHQDAGSWWNGLTAADRAMASGAILPFIRHAPGAALAPISWTHGLFFHGEEPQRRVTGAVDITGRARCLLTGPRIFVPPGAWSLSLTMSFARGAAEHNFLVELAADQPLVAGVMRPQQQEVGELCLDFLIDDATERPLALSVSSLRAAFDGAIAIRGATLRQAAALAVVPVAAAGD